MKRFIMIAMALIACCTTTHSATTFSYTNGKMPSLLPVVPTKSAVIFPNQFTALFFSNEDDDRQTVMKQVLRGEEEIVLLIASKPSVAQQFTTPTVFDVNDLFSLGTIATIKHLSKSSDGDIKMLVNGISRARVTSLVFENGSLYANIEHVSYKEEPATEAVEKLLELVKIDVTDIGTLLDVAKTQKPEKIAELLAIGYQMGSDEGQRLLECASSTELILTLHEMLAKKFEKISVKKHVENKAYDAISKANRKFLLEQQLKAIKKELGENKGSSLTEKLAALPLPEEVRVEVDRKLSRLEVLSPEHPDAEVVQTYLDWISKLPWGKETVDNLDIIHAKEVLDEDHYGLKEIKERILDYIAVRCLNTKGSAPILCLVGPPGVGKTSLVKSIARSLGRHYARISVGGMHDEAEIRGHRSTYVGAMPGRLIQTMKRAGSMNPVILIDEIDKMGRDHRGDPAAAMLEVLDPDQNSTFYDNYLAVPFDLSKVLFITTANSLDTLPRPLLDRMEVISLSGYSLEEKLNIGEKYLVKKAHKESGLEERPLEFSREVLADIIRHYTRESGVRDLERTIKKVCSKAARSWVETKEAIVITQQNLEKYLGPRSFQEELPAEMMRNQVGITNGLAWTAFGGEMLKIEAMVMPGKGVLILTGSLGSVMRESAQAALSYARSHAQEFGISQKMFTEYDLHVHVPAGATPKDGPSAGMALLSSILSAFTGRKIDGTYAMTGELNLRGHVMPIGGVKEKVLAAKRNGIPHVLLPMKNKKDLVGAEDVISGIDIIYVSHADEVLRHVLMKADAVNTHWW